jgi:glucokinase
VYVGTGVGGGIVVDDRLYIGAGHMAGEIGHTKVVWTADARPCGCGQRGCVEAYAGGKNLQARVQADMRAGKKSAALALAGSIERIHVGFVDQAAQQGDAYALALWAEVAPLLGAALANAVTLLNPDRLVLGGGTWDGAPVLRKQVMAAFETIVNAPTRDTLTIVNTSLGDKAGMLGAADLITRSRTEAQA